MKQFIKSSLVKMITLLCVLIPLQSMADTSKYGHQKVVYHVNYDSADRQLAALRNIQNQINAVGEKNIDVKVVMHGKGLTLLQNAKTDANVQARVSNLKMQGVQFNICANTMLKKKIALTDLYDASQEDVVPSGVAELSYLQSKGFTYLRP